MSGVLNWRSVEVTERTRKGSTQVVVVMINDKKIIVGHVP